MVANLMNDGPAPRGNEMVDALRGWILVALTFVSVALYGAALTGLLRPLADEKLVTRLEPLIFIIIGYIFGRLPAQQNEKTLRDEVGRQTQKADAAQHAKERALQSREALEEKVKNARTVLAPAAPAKGPTHGPGAAGKEESTRGAVAAALNILNS